MGAIVGSLLLGLLSTGSPARDTGLRASVRSASFPSWRTSQPRSRPPRQRETSTWASAPTASSPNDSAAPRALGTSDLEWQRCLVSGGYDIGPTGADGVWGQNGRRLRGRPAAHPNGTVSETEIQRCWGDLRGARLPHRSLQPAPTRRRPPPSLRRARKRRRPSILSTQRRSPPRSIPGTRMRGSASVGPIGQRASGRRAPCLLEVRQARHERRGCPVPTNARHGHVTDCRADRHRARVYRYCVRLRPGWHRERGRNTESLSRGRSMGRKLHVCSGADRNDVGCHRRHRLRGLCDVRLPGGSSLGLVRHQR